MLQYPKEICLSVGVRIELQLVYGLQLHLHLNSPV